jgi:hypothetical protein
MKPLDFTLDEMADLLAVLDDLAGRTSDREALLDRLRMYHQAAAQRIIALREQLDAAVDFADDLQQRLDLHTPQPSDRPV